MKVFLGGTCGDSDWRSELIKMLKINYFNPVVKDWTPQCQEEELKQRKLCDYVLYVITPEMQGVYSIAEVVDDSNKRPERTLLCVMVGYNGLSFTEAQLKSLKAVEKLIKNNGGKAFDSLESVADYLNKLDILDVTFDSGDLGKTVTVKEFLKELLITLWREDEGFSGKRPFGNSGWKYDMYHELIKRGIGKGTVEIDKDGDVVQSDIDEIETDKLIYQAIEKI